MLLTNIQLLPSGRRGCMLVKAHPDFCPLAHLVEHSTDNRKVVGSNPTGATNFIERMIMTNEQRKIKLKQALTMIDIINDKLAALYELHKAHCIKHNGLGLNPGYTLEDLNENYKIQQSG